MAFNFDIKTAWAKLPAKQRRIVAVVAAVCVTLGVIAVVQGEGESGPRFNKKADQISNVFTDTNNKNASIDSLAGQLKFLQRRMDSINTEMKAVRQLAPEQRLLALEGRLKHEDEKLQNRLDQLNFKLDELIKQGGVVKQVVTEDGEDAADGKKERRTRDAKSNRDRETTKRGGLRPDERRSDKTADHPIRQMDVEAPGMPDLPQNAEVNPFEANPIPTAQQRKEEAKAKRAMQFTVISEPEKPKVEKKAKIAAAEAYIPAGSILTGTIITGGDFPTNKGAFDQPTPLLIRLSKEAILPNRYTSDVRECFLLAGGAGDLASERAKLRGETLSCVRKDGSVIETQLNSYVTGEDGKEGIKGRLVSKQGQMIARSLVAGFAGGMSDAFDVDPVPVLATSTNGETQYQDALSTNAMRGAAVKGFSNSLDRIAQFYLDMAEDIFPVIEINAGRQVDVVVISGTKLKITASGAVKDGK